ncbi:hypothetical protein O6H91_16G087000 [Diphasiastrum complanatum]|uniref:Uncharacterized protein n=1 Tax=Diphasiastrum complanatum TaxID=34168 RepID=A0ACC2BEE4_DIPCM|nr:hypothetical protein O6H91_16G087000 [Diphasiastrum complanatum]
MADYVSYTWRIMPLITTFFCLHLYAAADVNAVERTLAMVKPDGVSGSHVEAIKTLIRDAGFTIAAERYWHFSEAVAKEFYAEHSERGFFPNLVEFICSGPSLALILEKEHAIADWRLLIGPTDSSRAREEFPKSIRAKFGVDSQKNCVHGSDSRQAAIREIALLFEQDQTAKKSMQHDEL